MKVAFIGNMNNNHFAMTRYLRERGVNAHLLLTDMEFDHFHPKADTFNLEYMDYTHQLTWGSAGSFLKTSKKNIRYDLQDYDILIGCGLAPAYCKKAGRKLDIFIPYGGDIWSQTKYRLHSSPKMLISTWLSVYMQKKAIAGVNIINMAKCIYEDQLIKLGASKVTRWYEGVPMVYNGEYNKNILGNYKNSTHWGNLLIAIRKNSDLMIFSPVRHIWKVHKSDVNRKGNDKLLKGVALFKKQCPKVKISLVTMEYGKDVSASKSLIKDLGIQDSVIWLPKMYRKDLMFGLFLSDISCANFDISWNASGVIYEALVAGKPIMMHRNDSDYNEVGASSLYKVINADSPESIADGLVNYWKKPSYWIDVGKEGQQWYETEVVERSLKKYLCYIGQQSKEFNRQ